VAGDAAVGEEIGRVGEDEVDGGFGDESKEFEAVAMVDAEVVFGVVEGGGGKVGGRFGHDDDRSGSLIRWIRESSGEETEARKEKELTQRARRRGKGFPQGLKPNYSAPLMSELKLRPPENIYETDCKTDLGGS
jgi:hypothetical protein